MFFITVSLKNFDIILVTFWGIRVDWPVTTVKTTLELSQSKLFKFYIRARNASYDILGFNNIW